MSETRHGPCEPYKRAGSPYWYYDVVGHQGRRQRRSTKTTDRREAMRVISRVLAEVSERSRAGATEIALEDAAAAYVAHLSAEGRRSSAEVARRTLDKTTGRGKGFEGRFRIEPRTNLSAITKRTLEALKNARAAEGNSPGTIGLELSMLRAASFYAVECEHLGVQVVKWSVPRGREKERSLSVEEAERVLFQLHPDSPIDIAGVQRRATGMRREWRQDAHDLFLALLLTGGRWAEIAALTWGQVDFERRTVTLFGFKTKKARTVPMIDRLEAMLRRRAEDLKGNLVFPSPSRRGPAVRGQCQAIADAIDRAGLNGEEMVRQFGRANIHTLRHTYATWLRQRGMGLDDIQPLLGHASLMTTRRYARVNGDESFAKAAEALQRGGGLADPHG